IYVMDIAPLEELTAEARGRDLHLCAVRPAVAYQVKKVEAPPAGGGYGGANPPDRAAVPHPPQAAARPAPPPAPADAQGQRRPARRRGWPCGTRRARRGGPWMAGGRRGGTASSGTCGGPAKGRCWFRRGNTPSRCRWGSVRRPRSCAWRRRSERASAAALIPF